MRNDNGKLTKKIIALLPMKGHSERVPNKNMRLFAGQPLFHHVAAILQASPLVESIIINTDSDSIAREAKAAFDKVRIVERPIEICGDFVPMNDIIAHDLTVLKGDHFLQTHSTNPLLTAATLENATKTYFTLPADYDSLFSVTRLQTRLYWESGQPVNHNPAELLRTQDLPPLYEENSNLYLFSRQSFQKAGGRRIGLSPQMFEMEALEAIDIDTEENFRLAEAIYNLRHKPQQ